MQVNAQRPMAVRGISEDSIRRAKRTPDGGAVILVSKFRYNYTKDVYSFMKDRH